MGMFTGASKAKVTAKGEKCSDGKHLLKIKRLTTSTEGKNGEYYVAEFDVVQSDSAKDATGRQIDPPGAERCWTLSMAKKVQAFPKLNAFIFAALGYNHKNAKDAADLEANIIPEIDTILASSVDESDPLELIGRQVWAVTKKIKTQKQPDGSGGFDFVTYDFSPGDATRLF